MEVKKFLKNIFEYKTLKNILPLRNNTIVLPFNMNGCFGNLTDLMVGTNTFELFEFLFKNKLKVYCFSSDKEGICYFNELKKMGVDIDIEIGPEKIFVEHKKPCLSNKTGKPLKKMETILKFNKKLEKIMENADLTIMNPPYGDLHLQILEEMINEYPKTNIINISPIRWLTDSLAEYKEKTDFNLYKNTVFKHIENVEFVSSKEAQNLFGADIAMDLGIYTINENGGWENTFKNKLVEKIYLKTKINMKSFDINKKDGYRVKISKCFGKGGHGGEFNGHCFQKLLCFYNGMLDGKKWWEFFNRNQHTKETDEIPYSFKFNSKSEAENFIDTTSSIIGKWYYDKLSIDVNVYPYFYLWLPSFKNKTSLKDICDYFEITGFIDENNADPGSDWETILNDMKD